MMSIDLIREINEKHAREAAEQGQTPYVYGRVGDVVDMIPFPFPFLGDYLPEGWEQVGTHFVDSSGLGADDEPALSVGQFVALIEEHIGEHPGTGWAITSAGQFQVYVGEYRRIEED